MTFQALARSQKEMDEFIPATTEMEELIETDRCNDHEHDDEHHHHHEEDTKTLEEKMAIIQ